MSTSQCMYCNAVLTPREAADGWCDSCGKKLPPGTRGAAAPSRPAADDGTRSWAFLVAWVAGAIVLAALALITDARASPDPAEQLGRLSFWSFGPSVVTVLTARGKGWSGAKVGGVYALALLGFGVLALLSALGRDLRG